MPSFARRAGDSEALHESSRTFLKFAVHALSLVSVGFWVAEMLHGQQSHVSSRINRRTALQ